MIEGGVILHPLRTVRAIVSQRMFKGQDARLHPFKYAGAVASAAISAIDPPATIGAAVRALVPAVCGLLDSTTEKK